MYIIDFPNTKEELYKLFELPDDLIYNSLDGGIYQIKDSELHPARITNNQAEAFVTIRKLQHLAQSKRSSGANW